MMLKDTTNAEAAGFAELPVMQLVTSGLPNKTVAHQLQLSVKTVEKHRGRLMKKLRLHSMCELFRFWFVLTWDEMLHSAGRAGLLRR